jgi:hypothetical protein
MYIGHLQSARYSCPISIKPERFRHVLEIGSYQNPSNEDRQTDKHDEFNTREMKIPSVLGSRTQNMDY